MSHLAQRAVSLLWTERLIGLALLLQTIELLQVRRALSDSGVWSFAVLRDEQRELAWPVRAALACVSPYRALLSLLVLRLLFALALMLGASWAAVPLLLGHLAVNARFRGTFNGGSDYMSVVVLLALSLAACFPSPTVEKASLAYVCVQLIFSYFIAGVVKLARPEWRSGAALTSLLTGNRYGVTGPWTRLAARRRWARTATWGILAFECTFPVALFAPSATTALLALGLGFHVVNAYVFGLNRFVFAWLAAYPALVYFSAQLSGA